MRVLISGHQGLLANALVPQVVTGGLEAVAVDISCDWIARAILGFRPQWTLPKGIEELAGSLRWQGDGVEVNS